MRAKDNLDGLVHHSDRGVQFLSIRYTERVAEIGGITSVGSRGDAFDNALAESIIGLYKTECARNGGVPRSFDDLELRTLEWIDWWIIGACWSRSVMSRLPKQKLRSTLKEERSPGPWLKEQSLNKIRCGSLR